MALTSKLFQSIKVGDMALKHRVVLAPLTRNRANAQHVHGDLAVEYYRQRASEPGTLLITEATFIAGKAGGYPHVPGLWNKEQTAAWKKVCCFMSFITEWSDLPASKYARSQMPFIRTSPISMLNFGPSDAQRSPLSFNRKALSTLASPMFQLLASLVPAL